jgi:hypothetical protein
VICIGDMSRGVRESGCGIGKGLPVRGSTRVTVGAGAETAGAASAVSSTAVTVPTVLVLGGTMDSDVPAGPEVFSISSVISISLTVPPGPWVICSVSL